MDRGRKLRRRAVPADVHVHHVRGLVQQMIVQRGLLDAAFLELREDRADLGLEQHQVTHQHRLRDRKSTRLNSSHGYISYAVFCLKKKKKKELIYVIEFT